MTYPRPRSLKRWRYGTPAWKRRCDAAIRRDGRRNEGKTGYAWMPHWTIPADDMQPVYAAAMEVSLAEETERSQTADAYTSATTTKAARGGAHRSMFH